MDWTIERVKEAIMDPEEIVMVPVPRKHLMLVYEALGAAERGESRKRNKTMFPENHTPSVVLADLRDIGRHLMLWPVGDIPSPSSIMGIRNEVTSSLRDSLGKDAEYATVAVRPDGTIRSDIIPQKVRRFINLNPDHRLGFLITVK